MVFITSRAILLVGLTTCLIPFASLRAQPLMPVIIGERGDTIPYTYPPSSSLYVPNELIIKFRPGALDLDRLCYTCPVFPMPPAGDGGESMGSAGTGVGPAPTSDCRAWLTEQRFPVDSGLVASPGLVAAFMSFGGDTLRRMTIASPCAERRSLSRRGDTLLTDDYNWMVLHLDNDTSVIAAALWLTMAFQGAIELAEPNYYVEPLRTPDDYYYGNFPFQSSLDMIGMPTAWDYATGSPGVRVGVIDDGIDCFHCDLGGSIGPKVKGGHNYVFPDLPIRQYAHHGTPCAGIIAAYTNRASCIGTVPQSGAGVAGGWGPNNGWTENNPGISLWGYAAIAPGHVPPGDAVRLAAAIREASAATLDGGYGEGMHVLNLSLAMATMDDESSYSAALRSAVNFSYEHGVSMAVARGNYGNIVLMYPACYDPSWVTNVGGSQRSEDRHPSSSYGGYLDLLAPFGGIASDDTPQFERTVYTTSYTGMDGSEPTKYQYFEGTSAAAPHVAGVMALIRSYLPEPLDPEDYEGMVKASARSQGTSQNYDYESGWGHLKAGRLFTMLGAQNYGITNFTVTGPVSYGEWGREIDYVFNKQLDVNKPLDAGVYRVRRREASVSFNPQDYKPGGWSSAHQLYIWGRGGNKKSGGFSAANPNFQTRWTEVTGGEGGNGLTAGILHAGTASCVARTFQYDVKRKNPATGEWEAFGHIPADEELAFHITIFGVPNISTVRDVSAFSAGLDCHVAPNPARGDAILTYTLLHRSGVRIVVVNMLGEQVRGYEISPVEAGSYESRLDLADLPQGIYYCRVEADDLLAIRPLTIAR